MDVLKADVVLLIGANPIVNHPVAATWIKNAVKSGTELILADPRRSELARHATHYLQFKADTDVAMLNAMMHVIIEEGLVDDAFIADRTSGYDALRTNVAALQSRGDGADLRHPGETIRDGRAAVRDVAGSMILWGMGISQHVHGTDNARCLIALCMLTGQVGPPRHRPASAARPEQRPGRERRGPDPDDVSRLPARRQRRCAEEVRGAVGHAARPEARPHRGRDHECDPRRADPRHVHHGREPAMSDPDAHHAREALAKLDMLVVQDIFLTETAYLADVILPASAFPEKTGTFTNTDRAGAARPPGLSVPPGKARQDLAIIVDMARELGLDWTYSHPARSVPTRCARHAVRSRASPWDPPSSGDSAPVTYPCSTRATPGGSAWSSRIVSRRRTGRAKLVPSRHHPRRRAAGLGVPLRLITGRQLEALAHGQHERAARRCSTRSSPAPCGVDSTPPKCASWGCGRDA
jgi:formate dehydrogenase major subunit